jgi:pantoate--beta-alanine ligase
MTTLTELRAWRRTVAGPVGLVPTMGYLHEGHLALVRRARAECAAVVTSIFVNPAQFGPEEDFATYPRDLDRDLTLLAREGVDVVFTPDVATIYPPGFQTWVEVGELSRPLEGTFRPGHFRGVATVVLKLFNMAQPDRAYFGQKDAQQARVVQQMVRDLDLPIAIVVVPTIREDDGLALSSRNVYLSAEERQAALVLSRALRAVVALWAAGEREAARLRRALHDTLASEPRVRPDYAVVADLLTLREVDGLVTPPALVAVAARVGRTRLIDNVVLGEWPA